MNKKSLVILKDWKNRPCSYNFTKYCVYASVFVYKRNCPAYLNSNLCNEHLNEIKLTSVNIYNVELIKPGV